MRRSVSGYLRGVCAVGVMLAMVAVPMGAEKARVAPPPLSAQGYPMHETHEQEHVTIAAEPGETKEMRPDTRVDYASHGAMSMRVIVTNDSESALTLDDARIHFVTADNSVIQAETVDDLQRLMFSFKDARGTKIPLPMPLPPVTIHHHTDKKIVADDADFSFKTTTVKPHTTVAGYLWYDLNGVDAPALDHATLELRKVKFVVSGKYLDSFEIPLKSTTATAKGAAK